MSSGIGIIKRSRHGLAHIVLLALSLGWGLAHAQSIEVSFVDNWESSFEGTSLSILLERTGSFISSDGAATATVAVDGGTSRMVAVDFCSTRLNWATIESHSTS